MSAVCFLTAAASHTKVMQLSQLYIFVLGAHWRTALTRWCEYTALPSTCVLLAESRAAQWVLNCSIKGRRLVWHSNCPWSNHTELLCCAPQPFYELSKAPSTCHKHNFYVMAENCSVRSPFLWLRFMGAKWRKVLLKRLMDQKALKQLALW